jgi:hypothetical protein
LKRCKQENRLGTRPKGHRKAVFISAELERLTALLKKKVDLTLAEIGALVKIKAPSFRFI